MLAAGLIIGLAMHGRRPDPGLAPFEAAGIMRHLAPEDATAVDIAVGARQWHYRRRATGGWGTTRGTAPVDADVASHIERGLHFLHVSAPQRVMPPQELVGIPLATFGLDPPQYVVTVQGQTTFTVQFGRRNPQGLAQYTRVQGEASIVLLPRFVGEQWERVIGER
jgi:hypothetical protein